MKDTIKGDMVKGTKYKYPYYQKRNKSILHAIFTFESNPTHTYVYYKKVM